MERFGQSFPGTQAVYEQALWGAIRATTPLPQAAPPPAKEKAA